MILVFGYAALAIATPAMLVLRSSGALPPGAGMVLILAGLVWPLSWLAVACLALADALAALAKGRKP